MELKLFQTAQLHCNWIGDEQSETAIMNGSINVPSHDHDEVRLASARLKINNAVAADGSLVELFKLTTCILHLFCRIRSDESMPNSGKIKSHLVYSVKEETSPATTNSDNLHTRNSMTKASKHITPCVNWCWRTPWALSELSRIAPTRCKKNYSKWSLFVRDKFIWSISRHQTVVAIATQLPPYS